MLSQTNIFVVKNVIMNTKEINNTDDNADEVRTGGTGSTGK